MDTTISDPLIGQWLDGRYRVDARVARGGMATVYRAHDMRLDRTVALKVMHASLAEDDSFVSRFTGEAKSAARLSHPNVVSVYDQGSDAGVVFLTMEFLHGRTLRDLLTDRGRLEPDEALEIMEAVLAAIGAAHQAGLVHRDVKPENVLVSDDGKVKVGDFGLARAIAASNHTKTSSLLLGTVAYLSPEQVAQGHADERSDVYAAGILLYELLTGRQPFYGDTPIAVAYQHVNEDVPAPSSVVPTLPRDLDALVAAATRREPELRPSDASGLLTLTTRVRAELRAGGAREGAGWSDELTVAVPRARSDTLVVPTGDSSGTGETPAGTGQAGHPAPPHRVPGEGSARKLRALVRRRGGALALVGLLALVLVAGYYYGWARWTEAPSLAGMKVPAATKKATRLGFDVEKGRPRFSTTVPAGRVISTGPAAGQRILEGGTITLTPSKGKPRVSVPSVHGTSVPSAKQALRAANLKVGEVTQAYSSSVALGSVVGTDPPAGTKVAVGSTVSVIRSAGVEVPDVTGRQVDAATDLLAGQGFEVDVRRRNDPNAPRGTVLAQDPAAGGAERGSTVTLTVSRGRASGDGEDNIDRAGDIFEWLRDRDSPFPF